MKLTTLTASVLFLVGCADNSEYDAALADCIANERNPLFDEARKQNSLANQLVIQMACEGMLYELAD
jgi:hypothetical protein